MRQQTATGDVKQAAMPFIVQCPHPDCAKYMLLEDAARGARVECLVCKRLIQVDASASGIFSRPPEPETPEPGLPPTARRHKVAHCPQCAGPMRVPPNQQGKKIQCPHCAHVFQLT